MSAVRDIQYLDVANRARTARRPIHRGVGVDPPGFLFRISPSEYCGKGDRNVMGRHERELSIDLNPVVIK